MSWPRRHELIDLDLDAYADESDADALREAPQVARRSERRLEAMAVSVLDAAERAGVPLEELLPKLDR